MVGESEVEREKEYQAIQLIEFVVLLYPPTEKVASQNR